MYSDIYMMNWYHESMDEELKRRSKSESENKSTEKAHQTDTETVVDDTQDAQKPEFEVSTSVSDLPLEQPVSE